MGRISNMIAKYHCKECAEYNKRSRCRETGVCPYADQMDEFRALNDETELIMYGKRRRVKNVETGMVYLSMSAAERDVDAGRGTIKKVLDNPTRTAGGYHWITA